VGSDIVDSALGLAQRDLFGVQAWEVVAALGGAVLVAALIFRQQLGGPKRRNTAMNYKQVNKVTVEGENGFRVQLVGFHTLEYTKNGKKVKIETAFEGPKGVVVVVVFANTILYWESATSKTKVTPEEKMSILNDIEGALKSIDVGVRVVN
jgi:hypothetical protein